MRNPNKPWFPAPKDPPWVPGGIRERAMALVLKRKFGEQLQPEELKDQPEC